MSHGGPHSRESWSLPLKCGYCGAAVTVECEKAVGHRQAWFCPAIGCARENSLANVIIKRVRVRPDA